jgi:hypothetical protein
VRGGAAVTRISLVARISIVQRPDRQRWTRAASGPGSFSCGAHRHRSVEASASGRERRNARSTWSVAARFSATAAAGESGGSAAESARSRCR